MTNQVMLFVVLAVLFTLLILAVPIIILGRKMERMKRGDRSLSIVYALGELGPSTPAEIVAYLESNVANGLPKDLTVPAVDRILGKLSAGDNPIGTASLPEPFVGACPDGRFLATTFGGDSARDYVDSMGGVLTFDATIRHGAHIGAVRQ